MELFLDSVNITEIEEAFTLGFLEGLTTTPTFMHNGSITDLDNAIIDLSSKVPNLQIEALGDTAEKILSEVARLMALGLKPSNTVFKIPMSLEGVKACRQLRNKDIMVNMHLVYTLQQAYMAMAAGATYVCPLVGRLQDQGQDALTLIAQCVDAVNYYGYESKVMFSSVRHIEHVRNAINLGVHACTVPWSVMQKLTDNHFTTLGTQQFEAHTKLISLAVKDVMRSGNPTIDLHKNIADALLPMTTGGYGCVSIVNGDGHAVGVFTDGDLRRILRAQGESALQLSFDKLELKVPKAIDISAALNEASKAFKSNKIDTLIVTDQGKAVGMIDIQDII